MGIRPDVAGATVMAVGTSLPELITSIIGVFVSTESKVQIGSIVGSAVFDILFVIAVSSLAVKEQVR